MKWAKDDQDRWIRRIDPDARFTLIATAKGDGRWSWAVFQGTTDNPMATGIASNLGAAKATMDLFIQRNT